MPGSDGEPTTPPRPAADAPAASGAFALGSFLSRWNDAVRHDLAASDSETLTLPELLGMAGSDALARWRQLGFGYPDPHGAPGLRADVATRYANLTAQDVLCCAGVQEAVACVVRALLGPDDHAVIVLPIYQPCELAVTSICAATGVVLQDRAGWRLDLDRVEAALRPATRLVLVNTPNSPTGASIDPAAMADLVALCRRHGLWLVVDEVYRQTHGADRPCAPPAAELYERGVSINGLSKGFGLPGLRVGWVACRDRDLLTRVLLAKSLMSSCLSATSEVLAHVALRAEPAIVGRTREIGERNLDRLRQLLGRHPELFADERTTNLAFAFPRYLGPDGADGFAARLVRDAGILLLPGAIWHSPLAPVPADRVRISLGHLRVAPALDALGAHLRAPGAATTG